MSASNPGLAGVLVSNGRDVAVTGPDGRYTLPLPEEATIFVIKPAGFMPPIEPLTNLPRFYRHHQPKGSPAELNLRFEGLAPTGPLPASVDFPLRRQDESKTFNVVMVTDPQPETGAEVDFIREDLIQALAGVDAKFGLTAGDVMFDDLSLYPRSNAIMGTIGLPWWNIGGNHDLNLEAPDRKYSRETFKRVFGPNYYAFFYAQTLFLMLDDVNYLGPDAHKVGGGDKYEGRLDEGQLEFVRNVLAHTPDDTLVVIVMHIPITTFLDNEPYQNLQDRDAFFALFEGRRYTVSFAGHTHTTEHHYYAAAGRLERRRAPPSSCADRALRLVVERALRSSRRGLGRQSRRHAEWLPYPVGRRPDLCDAFYPREGAERAPDAALDLEPLPWDQQGRRPRFHSGATAGFARSSRRAQRFDRDRQCVRRRREDEGQDGHRRSGANRDDAPARPDPFVQEVFARNEATKKAWVKAEDSSHIWTARLPPDLLPGTYPLVVEATGEYGQPLSGRLALEVTG